jgi:hypothetical protein
MIEFNSYCCTEEKPDMNRQSSRGYLWLFFSLFLVALCLPTFTAGTVAAENLLYNPGFEEVIEIHRASGIQERP